MGGARGLASSVNLVRGGRRASRGGGAVCVLGLSPMLPLVPSACTAGGLCPPCGRTSVAGDTPATSPGELWRLASPLSSLAPLPTETAGEGSR